MEAMKGRAGGPAAADALIVGAAGSGKSAYAEGLCVSTAAARSARLLYLATMPGEGEDARKRIERHRRLRAGKGFDTVEALHLLAAASPRLLDGARGAVALVECLGTLAANELFSKEGENAGAEPAPVMDEGRLRAVLGEAAWVELDRSRVALDPASAAALDCVVRGTALWLDAAEATVIVSNDVFADGVAYDGPTRIYQAVLGAANRVFALHCARVVEVVCGIPVPLKGGLA
ncbi:MAG: bifunctional adenosylcobinamide kinase/adenosylcobinamide-phosphate guanylyltransferase [Eggerthellaceae bacterium]|nr:bifunctional adenosylcobinamide kinase/adenosylcobinamide-phosphate guanylyltransferase [Eggerthellaceae bacterium]